MKIELKNNILQLRGISFADTDAVFAYFHTAKKKRYEYYQTNRVSINNRIIHDNHMLQEQDTVRIFLAMEEHNTCVRPLHRLDYETSGAQ